jgi:methyl-accepting chemotaxis protein
MKAEIREVAAQMQVISINGSIQAAKLGEKGNAFKIIVTEMRRLADQIKQITDKNYRAER